MKGRQRVKKVESLGRESDVAGGGRGVGEEGEGGGEGPIMDLGWFTVYRGGREGGREVGDWSFEGEI